MSPKSRKRLQEEAVGNRFRLTTQMNKVGVKEYHSNLEMPKKMILPAVSQQASGSRAPTIKI